jgi:hypothetical protein
MRKLIVAMVVFLLVPGSILAQSTNATITGRITDSSKASIVGARVVVTNVDTGVQQSAISGSEGLYTVVSLKPGNYKLEVEKQGFRTVVKPDLVLHVQDVSTINFELAVGTFSESITVTGGAPLVNTTDASVSTVVDRNFAENLPMNGRSFQTLIELTPGVVLTPVTQEEQGQFSVNGQRAASNYWTVDGVSANVGVSSGFLPGNGLAGALPASSALGGTNGLVSVDAMEEFRIHTSTYAPEFGRSPGGQISIVTRSGTNQFQGTGFDYLRNDVFDAKDWFTGYTNNPPLPKAEERQNDFGGTLGGPILKNRTFFFFSYEGFRLRLPQTLLTTVPDISARQSASPAMQPYLQAFPAPNGGELGNGIAQFNSSASNQSTLDASSLRMDHRLLPNLLVFGRYNYSPSELLQRGGSILSANTTFRSSIRTQTATIGATWSASPTIINDFRFNYSRTSASSRYAMDNFGGAVPLPALPLPSSLSADKAIFDFSILPLTGMLAEGHNAGTVQRQINVVNSVSLVKRTHTFKLGIDFRRLAPIFTPAVYTQQSSFFSVASTESGDVGFSLVTSSQPATLLFHNLGMYFQDTWRIVPQLTATYGIRWDVDFSPASLDGPELPAVTNVSLASPGAVTLAPPGMPLYATSFTNVAPRVGLNYQISQSSKWQTVIRGGFGIFYDLANSEVGNDISSSYPFFAFHFSAGGAFPLSASASAPPPITPVGATITAVNPRLSLPHSLQWNVALEQMLGKEQTVTVSYVGAVGRDLLQTAVVSAPNKTFAQAVFVSNAATSDYHALQAQFHRSLARNLQVLTSYTLSHSIDTASAGSIAVTANELVPSFGNSRASSSFDIRNAFSAGATYEIPAPSSGGLPKAFLHGWSIQNMVQARSAPPVDVSDSHFFLVTGGFRADVRPDLVIGQPLYLFGSQYPGGKAINPGAFTDPPKDATTGFPARQGTTPRNLLRGFGATQWDFAVHRSFPLHEQLELQFRAEFFNLLNHPNFGQPRSSFGLGGFGLSSQMLATSMAGGNLSGGALAPLYQIGGPRSVQLALKLIF